MIRRATAASIVAAHLVERYAELTAPQSAFIVDNEDGSVVSVARDVFGDPAMAIDIAQGVQSGSLIVAALQSRGLPRYTVGAIAAGYTLTLAADVWRHAGTTPINHVRPAPENGQTAYVFTTPEAAAEAAMVVAAKPAMFRDIWGDAFDRNHYHISGKAEPRPMWLAVATQAAEGLVFPVGLGILLT